MSGPVQFKSILFQGQMYFIPALIYLSSIYLTIYEELEKKNTLCKLILFFHSNFTMNTHSMHGITCGNYDIYGSISVVEM